MTKLSKSSTSGNTQRQTWCNEKCQENYFLGGFSPIKLKSGKGVCLIAVFQPLVTSYWSSVVDSLPTTPHTSEGNLTQPLTMRPGCWQCTFGLDIVFAVSDVRSKEWAKDPWAKLLQDYLFQTGITQPSQLFHPSFLP